MAQVEPDGPRLDYGFDAPVGLSLLCHSMGKSCTAVGISTTTYVRGVPLFLTYKHEVGNGHKGKFRVEEEAMVRFNNLFCLVGKHDDFEPGCTVTTSACGVRVHCKVGHSINMEKSAIVWARTVQYVMLFCFVLCCISCNCEMVVLNWCTTVLVLVIWKQQGFFLLRP